MHYIIYHVQERLSYFVHVPKCTQYVTLRPVKTLDIVNTVLNALHNLSCSKTLQLVNTVVMTHILLTF